MEINYSTTVSNTDCSLGDSGSNLCCPNMARPSTAAIHVGILRSSDTCAMSRHAHALVHSTTQGIPIVAHIEYVSFHSHCLDGIADCRQL
jgi:hypothetical protein